MKNVLEWTNEGCYEKSNGSGRAIKTMKNLNKMCANMKRRFPHISNANPEPAPGPNPESFST